MDDMSWNDYVASKRIVIISRLLGIAIALVGFLFVGDPLGEAQTMGIHELPIESGTLDGVRRQYIEEGSWWRKWTKEVTIAEIDGVEYRSAAPSRTSPASPPGRRSSSAFATA